ncbi:Stk1 family PASTA domain-containing Ser/Thr kinase [Pseudonocardia sp. 73-21]|uniref:Stk1 family PASTA domain-containing Ser/Thr kinase n=1 Tax=Pseudonocardia sp. 73-21 TaxID=1895809 RepID=UPI000968358F|nr:Stk1 family PASTA domain-containing Ser/Thr kinase [Pseudonocardia sp. 73-21]OJY44703.1 MAG: serine/threonine protein kinase [Pseudonocardia sp. 73-21]
MTTPRLLSERYELGEVLGYGGMSEVHRGLDTRLGRDVAVKVLRADLARDPQFQMRFRREAQNAAALNHPAIVAVYDTGEVMSESGPLPYIVMEYVDGQTLREIVKSTGPMTQQKVIEVMADVCAALDFSHRHQIIHRDVKPANIMINRAGAVKVMDFGIARALGEGQNVTQTAAVIGTAQYLSPEQARGEPVDARSDVYAAGCVLYELLTGEPPFTGDTPVAVAYQHVREEPKAPSQVNPSIPPSLDSVVLKALSKNPANRYQSAAEMRTDLVRVRSGQSPLAPVVMSEDERTAMMTPPTGPTRRINGSRYGAAVPTAAGYNDYYDEEPPRRTGRTIGIVAGVVAVLALIGFFAYQLLSGPAAPTQVEVPSVTGQTAQAASNAILSAQLRPNVVQVDSLVTQIGQVVSTDPPAGSKVAERSQVTISIGKGPAQVTVPKVAGQSVADATKLLTDAGLKVGTQSDEETTDPTLIGKVTRSDPDAGVSVAGASAVNIFIGKAPTNVKVPDVTGQDAATAQQTLQGAGFQVTTANVDGGGKPGSVLGTSPAAGSSAAKGSTVTLQLSNGNQGSPVPDVRTKSESDAKKALRAAGYTNIDTTDQDIGNNNPQFDGKVIAQSVPGGSTVDPNTQITLTVGKASSGGGIFGGN